MSICSGVPAAGRRGKVLTHEHSVTQDHDLGDDQQLLAGCTGVYVVPVAVVGEEG